MAKTVFGATHHANGQQRSLLALPAEVYGRSLFVHEVLTVPLVFIVSAQARKGGSACASRARKRMPVSRKGCMGSI